MADVLLSPALLWALAAGALLCGAAALFGRRRPLAWAFASGVCTVCAVLTVLALGGTLTQALTPALAVAALSLFALTRGEEGGGK